MDMQLINHLTAQRDILSEIIFRLEHETFNNMSPATQKAQRAVLIKLDALRDMTRKDLREAWAVPDEKLPWYKRIVKKH